MFGFCLIAFCCCCFSPFVDVVVVVVAVVAVIVVCRFRCYITLYCCIVNVIWRTHLLCTCKHTRFYTLTDCRKSSMARVNSCKQNKLLVHTVYITVKLKTIMYTCEFIRCSKYMYVCACLPVYVLLFIPFDFDFFSFLFR